MTIKLLSGRQSQAKWVPRRTGVREMIGQDDVERPCQVSHHGDGAGPTPNGSRLSCGASAGGRNRAALRYELVGEQTYASSESRPRQLQALVRQPHPTHGPPVKRLAPQRE